MEGVGTLLVIGLVGALYFLPTIVAARRKHCNSNSILLTNIFFGWTFIGWVVALIWANTDNTSS